MKNQKSYNWIENTKKNNMKKNYLKRNFLLASLLLACSTIYAQGTLEMTRNGLPTNNGFGTSINPMEVTFLNDAANLSSFTANTPSLTLNLSFRNQVFTGFNYGTNSINTVQTTGLVFGAGPSLASDPAPQGATPYNRYNIIGQYGGNGGPQDPMFTSSPSAAPTPPSTTPSGSGIKVAGSNASTNGGFELFTTAQVLYNSANVIGSRVYFGDVVLKFNRPVTNPVIHIAGLGGSYRFLPAGLPDLVANYKNIFFATELELVNTGLTSTLMSGNQFVQLSGNNILNNNDVNPNGGSVLDAFETPFNNLGAATGSVRLNGTVQEVVYRVYLQSGTGSSAGYPWSAPGLDANGIPLITGAQRDPFTGDIWYISASMDKPTQQVSGNIYVDRDGLQDGDINKSAGVDNPKTNAEGFLYANLLNTAGQVVASTPVSSDGTYLFNNVPVGTYSVQLTVNASAGTYASPAIAPATVLPAGYLNTGEFVGNTPGNDGTVNGKSADVVVAAGDIKVEVNFGIERVPNSDPYTTGITTPALNSVITLNPSNPSPLPVLSGSDPEDQPISGSLANKAVQITTLPTNSQLLYNGIPVIAGQIIPSYNPALLQIKFTIATPAGQTEFFYAYVDAAGVPDPTPARYRVFWPNDGPLPIVLDDFTAVKINCNANLVWKTSSELNSDKFEVEVSTATNNEFTKLGSIAASGSSSTSKTYQFNFSMESGVIYYFRLKMFNKDGSFTYSIIRSLTCTDDRNDITIRPNPIADIFTIRGMQKGRNNISIYSNDGKLVKNQLITNTMGDVNISKLTPGVYLVRILNDNGSIETRRIVKN